VDPGGGIMKRSLLLILLSLHIGPPVHGADLLKELLGQYEKQLEHAQSIAERCTESLRTNKDLPDYDDTVAQVALFKDSILPEWVMYFGVLRELLPAEGAAGCKDFFDKVIKQLEQKIKDMNRTSKRMAQYCQLKGVSPGTVLEKKH